MFDSKIAYSKQLYSIPVDLENKILNNDVPNEDLVFRRYKTMIIPIDGLLSKTSGLSIVELTSYFLRHSTLNHIDNNEDDPSREAQFPFKCIGMV